MGDLILMAVLARFYVACLKVIVPIILVGGLVAGGLHLLQLMGMIR